MPTDNDEISVDLDAIDDVKAKKTEEPEIKADDPPKLSPEEGLKKLQAQLDSEKAEKNAALTRARTAEATAAAAQADAHDNRIHLVSQAITQVTSEAEKLENQYAEMLEAGDHRGAAKIMTAMTTNSAKLNELQRGKVNLEKQPKPAAPATDPVEMFVKGMAKPAADWVRSHPEYATDEGLTAMMVGEHHRAIRAGHAENSPGYFKFIENGLGIGVEPEDEPAPPPVSKRRNDTIDTDVDVPLSAASTATKGRNAAPVSAPVSRTGTGTGERKGTIRLTREQIEAAEMTGVTPEEYARNMVQMKRDGRIN